MNSGRSKQYKNKLESKQLLTRVLAIIQRYDLDPQKLNGLRYECLRNVRGHIIPALQFMTIYKQYGLYMTLENQRDFFDYMQLGAPKNMFNLNMLSQLFQIVAKISFKTQTEAIRQDALEPKKSHLDRFFANLQSKLQIAFSDAQECLRFIDLNNNETIRIEEFSFGVQFFISNTSITDIILLFNQLDVNKDGQLDVTELTPLIPQKAPK